ncbi:TPA: site-specific DNA-methyltransferase, partial [Legionella pneumophila]|nr:site-specific DNA-methyltransferase [Legionella pneumophila]
AKEKNSLKFNRLYIDRQLNDDSDFTYIELPSGETHTVADYIKKHGTIPNEAKYFQSMDMRSSGRTESCVFEYQINGQKFTPSGGKSWKTNLDGMKQLEKLNRLFAPGNSLRYKFFFEDYPVTELSHMWMDTQGATNMKYVVQTPEKVIQRCILMTTDPGDIVLDPTCGGGTTAYVAENWGRRWITCDTSRVAITLTKQRLMTSIFEYYKLAHPDEGVDSGFLYKTAPHITIGSLTNNEQSLPITLYDQPLLDLSKVRVTGPFTVEAVPAPVVKPLDVLTQMAVNDNSVSRSGESLRQNEWKDELLNTGIRGKNGQRIEFTYIETLGGTRYLHLEAETKEEIPQRVAISFGSNYAPLEQRQVALAIEEALDLVPKPKIIIFAAFQFDPEAAKDIDQTNWPGVVLLKVQMNADLLTEDLKKKRMSNESFWLIGQPDIQLLKCNDGLWQVEVHGFDYYNTKTGNLESGGCDKIAMWMLDLDYDGRSLFPAQVFFPIIGNQEGWSKLAKNLKAEIDNEKIEIYSGTRSLPFEAGEHQRIAIKIVDDRGIESLKIMELPR